MESGAATPPNLEYQDMTRPGKVTLYAYDKAPMVHPVRIALHERGVQYDTVHVNPYAKPDWFRALSPTGQGLVPVLEVDGEQLFESTVINEYIAEAFDGLRLLPDDPVVRAKNRAWTAHALEFLMAQGGLLSVRRVEEYEGCRAGLLAKMARLEAQLGDGPYFNGKDVALIDFHYAAILMRQDVLDRCYGTNIIPNFEKVARWTQNLLARPSTTATLPQVEPGKTFDDIYLASFLDTYVSSQLAGGLTLQRKPAADTAA